MDEIQKDGSIRTIEQECWVRDRNEVIRIYGLNEPDIASYEIEEVE